MSLRLPLPLVLGLAMVAVAACKKESAAPEATGTATPAAPSENALAVTVVAATTRPFPHAVTVSGPVAPWEEMLLGVELSGARVTALRVEVGQAVKKGEVLLTLDHRVLDSDLAQANAALAEADAGAALAASNLARAESLVQKKLISAAQIDELRAARKQAEARRTTARAARDAAGLRRSFAELRAPQDGIISKRLVQPGQVVGAGMELLRLIRDGRLEWRAELSDVELARVQPGAVVHLTTRDGRSVEGKVRAVSPGLDSATRTGTVFADLPADAGVQVGSFLEGRIQTGTASALAVPRSAIVRRDGFANVFVVSPEHKAQRLRVQTGAELDGQVEILDGLQAGQNVVDRGAGFLGEGDVVRVVAPEQMPIPPAASAAPAGGAQ